MDGEVVWGYACCGGKQPRDSFQNVGLLFPKSIILGRDSKDFSAAILRAGTTRYLGASAACQKNASQFLLKAGGEGADCDQRAGHGVANIVGDRGARELEPGDSIG